MKFKGFSPFVRVTLLPTSSFANIVADLGDLIRGFLDKFGTGELGDFGFTNLVPTRGRTTLSSIKSFTRSHADARVITIVISKFYEW